MLRIPMAVVGPDGVAQTHIVSPSELILRSTLISHARALMPMPAHEELARMELADSTHSNCTTTAVGSWLPG
jgi:hypothetical protein